jgi:hypothetical protein
MGLVVRRCTRSQAPAQISPGLGGLPIAIRQGHQLLGLIGANPDDHQAAPPVVLQADVEVDAVDPPVHVVDARKVQGRPAHVLGLPGLGEPADARGRQAGLGAEELAQGGGESPVDSPRRYVSGSTSVTLGDLRMQAGRIADP